MSGKKVLWMILCFLLLMALALFAYRYLTDTQKHTAPVPESSAASAVQLREEHPYRKETSSETSEQP